MVASVLSSLDVLLSLLPGLSSGLLLLAKLADQVALVADLVPESADLRVLRVLVLLALLDRRLQVLDLVPQASGLGGDLVSGLLDSVDCLVLSLDPGLGLVNLL